MVWVKLGSQPLGAAAARPPPPPLLPLIGPMAASVRCARASAAHTVHAVELVMTVVVSLRADVHSGSHRQRCTEARSPTAQAWSHPPTHPPSPVVPSSRLVPAAGAGRSMRLAAEDVVTGTLVVRPGAVDPRDLELQVEATAAGVTAAAEYRVGHAWA